MAEASLPPRVVVIGGSTREGSTTEQLLRLVATAIHPDADIYAFCGPDLLLPPYAPSSTAVGPSSATGAAGLRMIDAVRRADVVLIGSPGYHGSLSGTVKNALDYLEELAGDEGPYLDGKVVACVATAYGWQAAVNTLGALRQIVAALRGWCTPYGVAVNVADGYLDESGLLLPSRVAGSVDIVTGQIRQFLALSGRSTAPV